MDLTAIKNKSLVLHQWLKNVAGTNWGLSKNIRRQLYLTVVEKVILYASAAWAHNITARQQKLLYSIQRKSPLNVTGAYNTTPTAVLQVIEGLIPLHIKNLTWGQGPSNRTPIEVYSDGSKINDQTGSSFCAIENEAVTKTWKAKLSLANTVFQAEKLALKAAIELGQHSKRRSTTSAGTASLASKLLNPLKKVKRKDVISDFLEDLPLSDYQNVWFQHDDAPPHKVSSVQQYIRDTFQQQVIRYGGCVEWPPRSPEVNPLDFFLWGYIKQRVYATPPPTLQELRNRITDACASVSPAKLYNEQREVQSCVQICIVAEGHHFEHDR
ncbi:hypothetical protein AVEN_1707-1 [Araneus ventricosus]|uniref:RNase H type-1 domain-containing protein n=1 Tax=Araneus ventricosus TaxID=182803 RepID=A0A4Y2KKD6_ARAVE|nr:hypothetical protein AVEN_1707-1 [Araneus ventricosus]